ncbi:NACHT, LRR and PYD domains-containing protein 12 isoform X1, partial [Silurus meridionalis]
MLKQENRTLLNEIYTELYITEGDSGDVNKEHEVKQIEAASRRNPTEDTPIKCSNIFKPLTEQDKAIRKVLAKPLSEQDEEPNRNVLTKLSSEQDEEPIRRVLTKGVSGIGKTVSVQKFVLDWAEGKTNQDIHLIFPLPFRELNLMKDQKLSLVELLHVFFKEMKEMDISMLDNFLFIFDGLDECRFPLNFQNTVRVCDVTESAPVHVLLINLIKGNLLPSAFIWITSRPAAADQIPSECVHRVTEVRGFNDPQKEEYFRKRISDQNLANKIITHLKSLRSLYILCNIPVFCWILAAVLERMLGEAESGEIPKTLTQMYTHFLIIQTNIIREKYLQKQESDEEMLLKLGKLAFQQLEKQNLIFYEEDLRECGIDVTEAAVYSGVCTQIFREEFGLHQSKVYCFVHLSIQEHLAALYVHLTFMKEQRNVFKQNQVYRALADVQRSAVDQALDSQTGHLDLFLRFLLGLSLESNQKLLHALVTQTGSSSQNKEKTVQYIKKKISKDLSTEKSINLFHCLNELGDDSLVEEIQQYLKSGAQSELSPSQWSALVFVLLTSAQDLEEFDLNKYITPDKIRDEILVRVMPVIAASRKAMLEYCGVSDEDCAALASALRSNPSHLIVLHLYGNKVGDSGMKCLSAVMKNPHCKLEILSFPSARKVTSPLSTCGVMQERESRKFYVRSQTIQVCSVHPGSGPRAQTCKKSTKHTHNKTRIRVATPGISHKHLSGTQEIRMSSDDGCEREMARFATGHAHKPSGIVNSVSSFETFRAVSSESPCIGQIRQHEGGGVHKSPERNALSSTSQSSVRFHGVGHKAFLIAASRVKCVSLCICRLDDCGVSDEGCAALASALRSNPSHLRDLNLTGNEVRDSGVKCLSAGLENPHCKLEILRLVCCGVSDEGCAALASALRSNPSHLRELDLSVNELGDSGVKFLSAVLENPHCKLEILRLRDCGVSDEGCAALASALRSNPSHLRELDLSDNKVRDSGVKCLSAVPDNPHCKLEILRLYNCGVSDKGCAALASALRSNPSHLIELNLSGNKVGDSGVKFLSAVLENPHCKLEILRLMCCGVSDEGCAALASALRSNPSHLRDLNLSRKLNLSRNKVGDSGVKCLSAVLENPHCKLEIL